MVGLLRDVFATPAVDPPAVTREKLRKRLAGEPSLEEALPLLFDVLEVPDPEQPMPQLSPEVRRRRIVEVLRQVTLQRGEAMVLLLEDLHWFDDQSRLFVEQLLPCTPGTRTLVVTNFRPEFQPSWMGEPYYRHVPLQALDRATTKELLLGYVGGDPSLTSLFDQVVTRTGGNPFFVEEVVRALVEDGTLEGGPGAYRLARPLGETRVPATVQATLAARIDRLPDAGKHALQAASVIGRTFSGLVLAHVLGQRIEELAEELVRLCAAQLLQGEGDDSTDDYRFWHPLTQEVAYGSLLRDRRARLHGAVARALVVLEPERLDARSALIASHFDRAGDPLEAARWERRAANWAQRSDFQDAKRRWHAVLGHLSAVSETEETLELGFEARVRIVQAGARIGLDTEEADLLLGEAEALAEQLHDVRLQGMVTVFRGSASLARMDFRRATQCFLEAGRLGDQLRDPGLMNGVNLCNLTGPLAEAAALTDRSIVHCGGDLDAAQESVGYSPFVRGLFNQADLWSRMARLPEARRQLDRAVALAREHSDTEVLAWGLSLYARLADWTGERDELLFDRARESSQLFEDSGSRVMQLFGLASVALALCLIGDWNEAESVVAQGLAQAGEVRNRWIDPDLLNCLALARLGRHDWTAARDAADEAVELAAGLGTRLFECAARTTRARGCRLTGALAEAEADLVTALDLVRSTDATTYEPFIHEELARLRNDEAELRQAFVLYQAMGAVGHARRVRADLS
jgi:adenylate cyclase